MQRKPSESILQLLHEEIIIYSIPQGDQYVTERLHVTQIRS